MFPCREMLLESPVPTPTTAVLSCRVPSPAGTPHRLRQWSTASRWLLLAILMLGCTGTDGAADDSTMARAASDTRIDLTGAGATFPYPLYASWFNEYAQQSKVRINYLSVGSGTGITRMLDGTVDFGASEAPLSDVDMAAASAPIVQVPTVLGAVAVTYNLPELSRPLNVSGEVLARIFLGQVTRWDDSLLSALNPGVTLPALDIRVVHRADASGTSFVFSDYLSAVSTEWSSGPGRGKDVVWPAGSGGRGNEGVAGDVKATHGAIGYVEVLYARQNHLPVAHVRNRAGRFISPMPYEIAAAAAGVMDAAPANRDLRLSLVNAPGANAYPIASFSWILLSPDRIGRQKTRQLIDFLRWSMTDGVDATIRLGYVALPTITATRVLDLLDSLTATLPPAS